MFQAFAMRRWLINKPIITTMIPPHCCMFNFSESNIHENIAVKTGIKLVITCDLIIPIFRTTSAKNTKNRIDAYSLAAIKQS